MFATTQAHDARVRRRARVDRDALPERWKRPFSGESYPVNIKGETVIAKPKISAVGETLSNRRTPNASAPNAPGQSLVTNHDSLF